MVAKLLLFILISNFIWGQHLDSIPNGKSHYFENLHKVTDSIYRCEQATKIGIKSLENLGIKSVLSLRNLKSDRGISKNSSLLFYQKRINAWTMSEQELVDALILLKKSSKPVIVHCVHGSDRTGTVIAAYRILYENWTKKEAINEMLEEQYGFHSNFQNLIRLLENLDIESIRQKVTNESSK